MSDSSRLRASSALHKVWHPELDGGGSDVVTANRFQGAQFVGQADAGLAGGLSA